MKGLDIPRRSRHLEIRICWLKERMSLGKLNLRYQKGTSNRSDMLTKCLGSSLFEIHREALGFETINDSLLGVLNILAKRNLVFIEVCCKENSSVSQIANKHGFQYVGITSNMQSTVCLSMKNFPPKITTSRTLFCECFLSSLYENGGKVEIVKGSFRPIYIRDSSMLFGCA